MKVIQTENIAPFDVDDTLVVHKEDLRGLKTVWVKDPACNEEVKLGINMAMVKVLKEEKYRGSTIIVWSRGGWEWAKNVVEALGLQDSVDYVLTKPDTVYDDKPVTEWLTQRVYLAPGTYYKGVK